MQVNGSYSIIKYLTLFTLIGHDHIISGLTGTYPEQEKVLVFRPNNFDID